MKFKIDKYKFLIIIILFFNIETLARENVKNSSKINWQKEIDNKKHIEQKSIEWLPFKEKEFIIEYQKEHLKNKKNILENNYINNFDNSENRNELKPLQISPTLQINNFQKEGSFSNSFSNKSSFGGGEAKGTGNQNYSYRLDYGLNSNTFISSYISEADDPYYYPIKNIGELPTKNYWRNYAINLSKKLNLKNSSKFKLSINSSLELWELATIYKKDNLDLGRYSRTEFLGSISTPLTYQLNNNNNLTLAPRITFLPSKIGSNQTSENFYGNNISLGIGSDLKIKKDLYLLSSYSFQLGPGYNSFNQDLVFSRKDIYDIGFKWAPNSIFDLRASLTNAFGDTPSTGHLTIPSGNLPLYKLSLKINQDYPDTIQRPFESYETSRIHKGHTVNNAILPERGTNQIFIDFDNEGNYFGSYAYSFSNLLQLEILNIGSYNNSDLNRTDKYSTLKNTFMAKNNLNNRFGAKLNFLSPVRGDYFWLSSRLTLGREQTTNQGYLFGEFMSTIEITPKLALNLNPKLTWSGIETIKGMGVALNYELIEKIHLIPEFNYIFSEDNNSNAGFMVRFLPTENKSIDFYVSNAEGSQDLGQMLKSKDLRMGIQMNYLF